MGLLRRLLTLPVSGPLAGAGWIAEKLHEAALAEWTDPGRIRKALEALEADLEAGRISEAAYEEAEAALLDRLSRAERAP